MNGDRMLQERHIEDSGVANAGVLNVLLLGHWSHWTSPASAIIDV